MSIDIFFHIEHKNTDDKKFHKTAKNRDVTPTGLEMT